MSFKQFSIQLILVTILVFLLLFLLGTIFEENTFDKLSFGLVAFFLFTCPFFFMWGKQAAHSPDLNAFSRMSLASIGIKMFLAIALVFVYVKVVAPESKFFLATFFTIYFSYTIFETYFLTQVGRESPIEKGIKEDGDQ